MSVGAEARRLRDEARRRRASVRGAARGDERAERRERDASEPDPPRANAPRPEHPARDENRRSRAPLALGALAGALGGFGAVQLTARLQRRRVAAQADEKAVEAGVPSEGSDASERRDPGDLSGALKDAAVDLALALTDAAQRAGERTQR